MARNLEFVTIEGLLTYAEELATRPVPDRIISPLPPPAHSHSTRLRLVRQAMPALREFAKRADIGFRDAQDYQRTLQALCNETCDGDPLAWYAAWNYAVADGILDVLLRVPIRTVQKPLYRRPVAIVPRAQLTPHFTQDRIVLHLGDDRFWLLPRDLNGRTLLFAMRHGVSLVDSKTYRVGCRLANELAPDRGIDRAKAVGQALARMLGLVEQQLDFLAIHNYLDPRQFVHLVSSSPNTTQLFEQVHTALCPEHYTSVSPLMERTLDSQDFGWVTGMEKQLELETLAHALQVESKTAKRLMKHPLYRYPGGNSFLDTYLNVVDGIRKISERYTHHVVCLYTHSSTLRALMIYLDPRPFREAFTEFGEYKESQDNVVLLTHEQGKLSGYSTAVGLSQRERAYRETWFVAERARKDRVTLRPGQIKRLVTLVSGGDFAGAGAALKELRVTGHRLGLEVYFVRHGFLGLANKWIDHVTEQDTRGMGSHASSPIGSSRFEDFKEEEVQEAAIRNLSPFMKDGALVVIGGDGSLRGARALYELYGIQVIGIPGTIDNNIAETTALGFHSAVALANQSIESLKATSAAMGSIFFVEVMGAGSGHLALACAYQARAEGVLVNEHPDPDAYIEEMILGTLRRTLGIPNKSHIFVVAEQTPHRHHPGGGVHGLVEYVAKTLATFPQCQSRPGYYPLPVATKATILGHTLRGAPPTPVDKAMAQDLAYEAIRRVVQDPMQVIGSMLAYKEPGHIDAIPLHAIAPKPFDWELFARMHGTDLLQ